MCIRDSHNVEQPRLLRRGPARGPRARSAPPRPVAGGVGLEVVAEALVRAPRPPPRAGGEQIVLAGHAQDLAEEAAVAPRCEAHGAAGAGYAEQLPHGSRHIPRPDHAEARQGTVEPGVAE